jgi:hypothetical protein
VITGRKVAIMRGETGSKIKKFQQKEIAVGSELAFLSHLRLRHTLGWTSWFR